MNIVSNCPLCEARGLHVMEDSVQQCLNCGFVTSEAFIGTKKDNESYKQLPEEMRMWSKEVNDRIWIPSMITLPFGTLYPLNIEDEMKWAFAEMVDIPEEEQKNYPVESGEGFYKQRYDTDNQIVYDEFLIAMAEMNERAKKNAEKTTEIKLPKLKKVK